MQHWGCVVDGWQACDMDVFEGAQAGRQVGDEDVCDAVTLQDDWQYTKLTV